MHGFELVIYNMYKNLLMFGHMGVRVKAPRYYYDFENSAQFFVRINMAAFIQKWISLRFPYDFGANFNSAAKFCSEFRSRFFPVRKNTAAL